jgi:hypothetical protein
MSITTKALVGVNITNQVNVFYPATTFFDYEDHTEQEAIDHLITFVFEEGYEYKKTMLRTELPKSKSSNWVWDNILEQVITNESSELSQYKSEAKIKIDVAAGVVRAKYLTIAPGQEMTYMKKEIDAENYKAANFPFDTSQYPWIHAEVEQLTASNLPVTGQEIAMSILNARDQWLYVGTQIEAIRREGKIQIDLLTDIQDIIFSRDGTINALELI